MKPFRETQGGRAKAKENRRITFAAFSIGSDLFSQIPILVRSLFRRARLYSMYV